MHADLKGIVLVAIGAYLALVVFNGFNASATANV